MICREILVGPGEITPVSLQCVLRNTVSARNAESWGLREAMALGLIVDSVNEL